MTTTNKPKPYKAKYWNHKGKHQTLYVKLAELIPASGECADSECRNRHLDKLRRAASCYYDLFNNGLCNRAEQAVEIFGFNPPLHEDSDRINFEAPEIAKYDRAIDRLILNAAKEQGIK